MKKLLLIPILAGAALLAQPGNADAGISFNIGFGNSYACNSGYAYRPLYRPGYYGPTRVVIVDGHKRYLRPWNQRPGFRRAAKAQRRAAYRTGYRQGARQQYYADRGYRGHRGR